MTAVTVVVVTWQGAALLRDCLDSLAAQTQRHELVVVDNASTDGTAELLATRYPSARVHRLDTNTGFAGGVQAGLDLVGTPYAAILNNDAVAEPGWLAALTAALDADPGLAAVTSRMLLTDGSINNAGVSLTATGYGYDRGLREPDDERFRRAGEVFGFSGGAAALRMDAVRAVGGFARRFFLYYEDTDLSWRLRLAAGAIRYVPDAVVYHRHAVSTDPASVSFHLHNERNRLLMLTRCAPAAVAGRALLRFAVTTGSLALRGAAGRPVPRTPQFRAPVRLAALRGYLRMLPWALGTRRQIGTSARCARGELWHRWAGHDGL